MPHSSQDAAPQIRKRPAPTTEIGEDALGEYVSGLLKKAAGSQLKKIKTATGAKVTSEAAPTAVLKSTPKPPPAILQNDFLNPRKILTPKSPIKTKKIAVGPVNPPSASAARPTKPGKRFKDDEELEAHYKSHRKTFGSQLAVEKNLTRDRNVEIIKLPPSVKAINVTEFEKAYIYMIEKDPNHFPNIKLLGTDKRGYTVVRREKMPNKRIADIREMERKRKLAKARSEARRENADLREAKKTRHKSAIMRARVKLIQEEERILQVGREVEENGARRRAKMLAERKANAITE
ncbi:unnamed protein product [Periconia digitata]|uniref:Uncharacterized protein n=1 Tax=Periconia digitata TaxID=1303443 RepID=A0A9W4UIZ1_9PLEO|nr:unnamed protein product [Periconia digitata]